MMNTNTVLIAVQAQLDGIVKTLVNAIPGVEHISSVMVTDTVAYFATGYRSDMPVALSLSCDVRVAPNGAIQIMLVAKASSGMFGDAEERAWWLLTDRGDEQKVACERIARWFRAQLGA